MSNTVAFDKMHSIGNDFVLIDNRLQQINISTDFIKSVANRHTGIGFDQLLLLEESELTNCDAAYRFFNPDGTEAEQCGNGQRCISKYLNLTNPVKKEFCVSGLSGLIYSKVHDNGLVTVNMGTVQPVEELIIAKQTCYQVNFGNPHLVTIVADVDTCNLTELHNKYSHDYQHGINLEIVELIANDKIKIRVHERGTGETLGCGSGACASVVALQSIKKLDNKVKVILAGGNLLVEYRPDNNNIYLTGSAVHVFSGEISI